jgi:hypothetical protein
MIVMVMENVLMVIVFVIKDMKEKTVRIVKVVMKAAINMENV